MGEKLLRNNKGISIGTQNEIKENKNDKNT